MNETPPGLANNRFEALHQKLFNRPGKPGRWRRRFVWALLVVVCVEVVSLVATFGWYWTKGTQSGRLLDQFIVTRYLVSPFVFDNPVKAHTKARYLGPLSNQCVAAEWRPADTLLGWSNAKNVGILKQPYLVPEVTGWRFTNEQGFASSGDYEFFYARPKPKGTYRVIVTGASTVEGDGAEHPKSNLVAQFRARLEDELKGRLAGYERIEVINAGVGGYQSSQEYLYLISELVTYEPDLVISYSGGVDVVRASNAYDREGRRMEFVRTFRHDIDTLYLRQSFTILSPLVMFASNIQRAGSCFIDELAMSYFIGRVYDKGVDLVRRVMGSQRKLLERQTKNPDLSIPIQIGLDSWSNTIKLMMKASEIYEFRLAVVLQPVLTASSKPLTPVEKETLDALGDTEIRFRTTYWPAAQKMISDYAAANGANNRFCFVDASNPFEGVRERVWDDSRHLLGAGNRIVGVTMVKALQACKQLPVQ
jgi:type IV secretory pathway protease TraF